MSAKPAFWFPLKRYGFGWGLPVRWQGWLVFVAYAAFLYAGIDYFEPREEIGTLLVYVVALTAVLLAIIAVKGERPLRWRWGGK